MGRMMKDVLIKNGTVVPMDGEESFYRNGMVLIRDGIIRYVGSDEIEDVGDVPVLDARGGVIMPGFINAHMHLYSTFARGMSPKMPPARDFNDVLERLWFPLDRQLSAEDIRMSSLAAYVECIRMGTTTIIDHHESQGFQSGSLDQIVQASREAGVRSVLSYGASDRYGRGLEGVEEGVRFLSGLREDGMIAGMMGLHALFTVGEGTLRATCEAAEQFGSGIHVHVAEAAYDQSFNLEAYGVTALKRLADAGGLSSRCIIGHGVHMTEDDMDLMAASGAILVTNPQSNMHNAVGVAPSAKMLAKGVRVALGTDSMTCNMREEMRALYFVQRLKEQNPSGFFAESCDILLRNRDVAGEKLGRTLGCLKAGAAGDAIVLDYNPPTSLHLDNFWGHLIYGMSNTKVDSTVVDGVVLMKHGTLTTIDECKVMAESRTRADKLWDRF
ncbi:MAG: putative aminohydrolase SsnA [Spartobacteria bacterium]|nr:putative aminohydrolase SsnA [Spartobacteria bacterium]